MKNEDLIKKIVAIDKDAKTDGLSNAELVVLLKSLEAPEPEDDGDEPSRAKGYYVCAGKSVTSLKGILCEGDKVDKSCFNNGEETLKRLVKIRVVEVQK